MKIQDYSNNFLQCVDRQYKINSNIITNTWYIKKYKETKVTGTNIYEISTQYCIDRFNILNEIENECIKNIDTIFSDKKIFNFFDLDYEYKKCFINKIRLQ